MARKLNKSVHSSKPFLSARWSNLCLISYAVPADLLRRLLPEGLELDLLRGQAFASLVCFDFLETRVLGIGWPGFRNFPEINLRTYVRHGNQRGVLFVRELVPQPLVAFLARVLYNEPYRAACMRSVTEVAEEVIRVSHEFQWQGRTNRIVVEADAASFLPEPGSTEHFFKEHSWGFGTDGDGRLIRYEVSHPLWRVHTVKSCQVNLDWRSVYGDQWAGLSENKPQSVILAQGSEVAVFRGKPV